MWDCWYLDDGLLVGDPARLSVVYQGLGAHFATMGLQVNAQKCEIWGPGASYCTGMDNARLIPWEAGKGVTVLGTPIIFPGGRAQLEKAWRKGTTRLKTTLASVTQAVDTQVAHHLLRKCMDACKVTHLMRAADAYGDLEGVDACTEAFCPLLRTLWAQDSHRNGDCRHVYQLDAVATRAPSLIRSSARMSALVSFYQGGAARVGVPDVAAQV